MALLSIRDLTVRFAGAPGAAPAVAGVSLEVEAGECVALVGESGSGKSQLLLACLGLLAGGGQVTGSAQFDGRELLGAAGGAVQQRGRGIGLVFQDATGSLTPHRRIGALLAEVAVAARRCPAAQARREALRMLERVRLPDAARWTRAYPHELSGGMRQRVALAAALMAQPRLLFADEPTTALDPTVQAGVIALLDDLRQDTGMALLLVTHDLGVATALASRVAVMRAGRIVESAATATLLREPRHPYTAELLAALASGVSA